MTFGKTLLGAAAAIGLFAGATGSASALSIDPFNGSVKFKFSGFTTEIPNTVQTGSGNVSDPSQVGGDAASGSGGKETTWGAGYIDEIQVANSPNTKLWKDGKNNETAAYFLYGISDISIKDISPADEPNSQFRIKNEGCMTSAFGGASCSFGGIVLEIWQDTKAGTNPDFAGTAADSLDPGDRSGNTLQDITTDGTLAMRWVFVPGIVSGDNSTELVQTTDGTTLPATGKGSFYANCVAGTDCGLFDTQSFSTGTMPAGLADLLGIFTLLPTVREAGADPGDLGWLGQTFDPVQALQQVPEPTTLSLLGMGLLGLGAVARRRRRQA